MELVVILVVVAWLASGGLAFALLRFLCCSRRCERCKSNLTCHMLCNTCSRQLIQDESAGHHGQSVANRNLEDNASQHRQSKVSKNSHDVSSDISATLRLVRYAQSQGWLERSAKRTVFEFLKLIQHHHRRSKSLSETNGQISEQFSIVQDNSLVPPQTKVRSEEQNIAVTDKADTPVSTTIVEAIPVDPFELDDESPVDTISTKARVQRSTVSLLESFMRRANIRWIELVSSALVVFCSVGLVVSLWSTLSNASRFFPSIVFAVATMAVHGAGQYTLKKWKLRNTSRGILHIGLMLIPLALLTSILLVRRSPESVLFEPWSGSAILGGAVVYFSLAISTSRALFGRLGLPLGINIAVVSCSILGIFYLPNLAPFEFRGLVAISPAILSAGVMGLLTFRTSPAQFSLRARRRYTAFQTHCTFGLVVLFTFTWHQFSQYADLRADWWTGSISALGVLAARSYEQWERAKRTLDGFKNLDRLIEKQLQLKKQQSLQTVLSGVFLCVALLGIACVYWFGVTSKVHQCISMLILSGIALTSGLRRERFLTILAGCVSALLGIAFIVEYGMGISAASELVNWVTRTRSVLLHVIGAVALVTGVFCVHNRIATRQKLFCAIASSGLIVYSAGAIIALSNCLFGLLASDARPWAELTTLVDGVILVSIVSTLHAIRRDWYREILSEFNRLIGDGNCVRPRISLNAITVVGLAVMLCGAFAFAMSNRVFAVSKLDWQTNVFVAAIVSAVALIWSVSAMLVSLVNPSNRQRSDYLTITSSSAVILSTVSTLVFLFTGSSLANIASLGWMLPITIFAASQSFKHFHANQLAFICTGVWAGTFTWWILDRSALGLDSISLACISGLALLLVANLWPRDGKQLKGQYAYSVLTAAAFFLAGRFLIVPAVANLFADFSSSAMTAAIASDLLRQSDFRSAIAFLALLIALVFSSWRAI